MSDKLDEMSWSWISVKQSAMMIFSFISFFVLYFSVYVCEAFMIYTWTLLYVFSPILIAFFVLPQTSGATKALFRSLFEVSMWKIVWSCLATLLWSAALSDMNKVDEMNFITVICFNLILAGSVLLTPLVVKSLSNAGLSGFMGHVGGIAIGAGLLTPGKLFKHGSRVGKQGYNMCLRASRRITKNRYPRARRVVNRMPEFNVPKRSPVFKKKQDTPPY